MEHELKILFVEDLPADVELELRELHRAGIACVVRRVDNEADFRRELAEFAPDLILSDYTLPSSFDGLQALTIAQQECPDVPYLFVSGTIGEERAIEALKRGATDYVLKENLARLAPAVERAVREAKERAAREEAQQALRESELRKGAILESALDCIISIDSEGRIIEFNPAAEKVFGCTRDQVLGKELAGTIIPPALRDAHRRGMARYRATGEGPVLGKRIEIQAMRSGGAEFPVELAITPIRLPDQTIFSAHLRDITERKQAEEALWEQRVFLRNVIDADLNLIFVKDWDGRFTLANKAVAEIYGTTPDDLVGRTDGDFNPNKEEVEHFLRNDREVMATLRPKIIPEEPVSNPRTGKTRWFQTVKIPLVSPDGKVKQVLGVATDITERKQQEMRIARLSRIRAVLSGINSTIVRVRDRQELLNEACRVAVDQGRFRMAWIGWVDPATLTGRPVAFAGYEEGFLKTVRLTVSPERPESEPPSCRALRDREPVACNDIAADPLAAAIRTEALARGYRSVIALPLFAGKNPTGVLVLFGGETDLFDQEEMKLLTELAGDVSFALEVIEKEERLNYLAYFDPLTGLANRSLFIDRVNQHISALTREASMDAVILLDLERLRNINESLGRQAGDSLLRQVAERLKAGAPDEGHVARLGADQFGMLLTGIRDEADLGRIVEQKLDELLARPYTVDDHELRVSAKGGIAVFPSDGADSETLIANAEVALARAKATADKYLFYTSQMNARVSERLTLENRLRQAVEENQFVLHYQPKVNLVSEKIEGLEALIRWNDPQTGLVPPYKFISILEETGMILEVGKWVMEQAHHQYQQWREKGLNPPRIAVNVSALQIREKNFTFEVKRVIGISGTHGLDLEITESLIMENIEDNIDKLRAIKAMGANVAIDDFGTGYSSLSYLAKLPVDALKIDRAFVNNIAANPDDLAIVSTMISLAHSLDLKVIAEGVETEEQKKLLRLLKCDEMQGYLFSPPVPLEKIEAMLAAQT